MEAQAQANGVSRRVVALAILGVEKRGVAASIYGL